MALYVNNVHMALYLKNLKIALYLNKPLAYTCMAANKLFSNKAIEKNRKDMRKGKNNVSRTMIKGPTGS